MDGPLSEAVAESLLDTWAHQIREATVEASNTHQDAISLATWEKGLTELKRQLNHARPH